MTILNLRSKANKIGWKNIWAKNWKIKYCFIISYSLCTVVFTTTLYLFLFGVALTAHDTIIPAHILITSNQDIDDHPWRDFPLLGSSNVTDLCPVQQTFLSAICSLNTILNWWYLSPTLLVRLTLYDTNRTAPISKHHSGILFSWLVPIAKALVCSNFVYRLMRIFRLRMSKSTKYFLIL